MSGSTEAPNQTDSSADSSLRADPSAAPPNAESSPTGGDPTAVAGQTPEASPAPQAPAYPTAAEIAQANERVFAPLFQRMGPQPPAPKYPWDDPKSYWAVDPNNSHSNFHERVTKYAEHIAEQKFEVKAQQLLHAVNQYLNGTFAQRFAPNPNYQRLQARAQQIASQGMSYDQLLHRLAELESGQAPPNGASPTAQRAIPMPPRSATSPTTRTAPAAQAPPRDRSKPWNAEEATARLNIAQIMGGQ